MGVWVHHFKKNSLAENQRTATETVAGNRLLGPGSSAGVRVCYSRGGVSLGIMLLWAVIAGYEVLQFY